MVRLREGLARRSRPARRLVAVVDGDQQQLGLLGAGGAQQVQAGGVAIVHRPAEPADQVDLLDVEESSSTTLKSLAISRRVAIWPKRPKPATITSGVGPRRRAGRSGSAQRGLAGSATQPLVERRRRAAWRPSRPRRRRSAGAASSASITRAPSVKLSSTKANSPPWASDDGHGQRASRRLARKSRPTAYMASELQHHQAQHQADDQQRAGQPPGQGRGRRRR